MSMFQQIAKAATMGVIAVFANGPHERRSRVALA